jgi:PAP_fibrillin
MICTTFLILLVCLAARTSTAFVPAQPPSLRWRTLLSQQTSVVRNATISSATGSSTLPDEMRTTAPQLTAPEEEGGTREEEQNAAAARLRQELLMLAERTDRGFQASARDRERARHLIFELATFNPTTEPASAYYTSTRHQRQQKDGNGEPSVQGKWTLLYTDAPDITGLDQSPFSALGRIGQECDAPYIKNVIEWRRPAWAANLPLTGTNNSRVLQKVVTKATARSSSPTVVNLELSGLQIEADSASPAGTSLSDAVQKNGLVAGLLQNRPVDWSGPGTAPFGMFEILYLDDDLRITKTGQNYVTVNKRVKEGEEWF